MLKGSIAGMKYKSTTAAITSAIFMSSTFPKVRLFLVLHFVVCTEPLTLLRSPNTLDVNASCILASDIICPRNAHASVTFWYVYQNAISAHFTRAFSDSKIHFRFSPLPYRFVVTHIFNCMQWFVLERAPSSNNVAGQAATFSCLYLPNWLHTRSFSQQSWAPCSVMFFHGAHKSWENVTLWKKT